MRMRSILTLMKPLNLYRSDGDRTVWEQAERRAKARGLSLSAYLVAVLREYQEVTEADREAERYRMGADFS